MITLFAVQLDKHGKPVDEINQSYKESELPITKDQLPVFEDIQPDCVRTVVLIHTIDPYRSSPEFTLVDYGEGDREYTVDCHLEADSWSKWAISTDEGWVISIGPTPFLDIAPSGWYVFPMPEQNGYDDAIDYNNWKPERAPGFKIPQALIDETRKAKQND